MATLYPVGGKNYTLSSSISSTVTSITLTSFTLPVTDQAITMATANTSIMYGTLQPGTTNSEFISFTGITQNANGTATLTGVTRGLDREYPYTEASAFKLPHPGQSIFILSNVPQLYNSYTAKVNDETVIGKWTFPNDSNTPLIGASYVAPTIDNQVATKKYADDLAIAGSPKATESVYGITKLSVAAVSPTDPIAVGDNDTRMPTQGENDALVGTSGTPSSSNKYVTNDDTATTATASAVVRANSSKKIDPAYIQSFAGDGSDGALTVSSGTTNIDLGAQAVVIKNYTSVSITGTGAVTFSNPHANGTLIIIKSQGNVTLTSSTIPNLDASGMGAAGGAGGALSTSGVSQQNNGGTTASIVNNYQDSTSSSVGVGGTAASVNGGAASSAFSNQYMYTLSEIGLQNRRIVIAPGNGGGGGSGGQSQLGGGGGTGGTGGRGGGALVIQCGGALNFTATLGIDVSGKNGSNGTSSTTSNGYQTGGGGGGGGGGSGMCLILYNTLTAATGTVNAKGGNGGTGGNVTVTGTGGGSAAGAGGGGSGGATLTSASAAGGNAPTVGGGNANGNVGNSASASSGAGGGGGTGAIAASGTAYSGTGGTGGTGGTTSTSLWYITKNNYFA